MKNLRFAALLAFVVLPAIAEDTVPAKAEKSKIATPVGWSDDFAGAHEKARQDGKDLLVAFSGSDWCGWCIRLEKEVFHHEAFTKRICADFVPAYVDLPQDKSRLSPTAAKQNPGIVEHYRIERFPAVLLIDGEGDIIAQTGYVEGGWENFLKIVKKLYAEGKRSPEYKAQKALRDVPNNSERPARLHAILRTLSLKLQIANGEYVREVLASDADGSLGFRKDYPYFTQVFPLEKALREELVRIGKLSDKALAEHGTPEDKAEYVKIIAEIVRANAEKLVAIREQARQTAKTFPPDSEIARRLDAVLSRINDVFTRYIETN